MILDELFKVKVLYCDFLWDTARCCQSLCFSNRNSFVFISNPISCICHLNYHCLMRTGSGIHIFLDHLVILFLQFFSQRGTKLPKFFHETVS